MNGEYLLSLDPYNFNTEEEYLNHHYPELLQEIRSFKDDENITKENLHKR